MTTYNGWPNHETWVASLYCESLEDVRALREYLEEMPFFDLPLPVMDLLLSAMAEIKWDYLERSYAEDNAD
jgi:hypothetical protein